MTSEGKKLNFEGKLLPRVPINERQERPQPLLLAQFAPCNLLSTRVGLSQCKECSPLPGNVSGAVIDSTGAECNHPNWIWRGEKWAHRNSEWLSRQVWRWDTSEQRLCFFFEENCKGEKALWGRHTLCPCDSGKSWCRGGIDPEGSMSPKATKWCVVCF